jgi:hypothetical protein
MKHSGGKSKFPNSLIDPLTRMMKMSAKTICPGAVPRGNINFETGNPTLQSNLSTDTFRPSVRPPAQLVDRMHVLPACASEQSRSYCGYFLFP